MAVRIAQITDMHLTGREYARTLGAPVWRSFRQALAFVSELGDTVDRLVLTGDLVHQRRAATYRRLRAAVAPWAGKVLLIPGNHDDRSLLIDTFSDRLVPDRATANVVDGVGGLRLVGLDSLRPRRAHGRVGAEQLRWLRDVLGDRSTPTLLFVHHPPVRVGCWWLDKDRLRDADQLADVVRGRVDAILCGHVHQEFRGSLGGVPVYTCPSTAYQFRPRSAIPSHVDRGRPGLRLIDWEDGELRTKVIRVGRDNGERQRFRA